MRGRLYGCPVELSLDLIGGKWKTIILARLKDGACRYGQLRALIPDLSDKILTQRLHELQESGLVERRIADDGHVHYVLTIAGRSLEPMLNALFAWGEMKGRDTGARFRPSPQREYDEHG